MKRKLFSLTVTLALCAAAGAFEPTTAWPYLYETFTQGRITTFQSSVIEYDRLNVNLGSGRVHFVKDGVIMEVAPATVALLTIGQDSFVCIGGRMMRVLRNSAKSAAVESVSIDTDAMGKADIGYGKSSLASTQSISVAALSSMMDFSLNRSLDDVFAGRANGDRLELKKVTGIVYKGSFIPASRSAVLAIPGIDKAKVRQFIKDEKIRFRNTEDLCRLADFLYSL